MPLEKDGELYEKKKKKKKKKEQSAHPGLWSVLHVDRIKQKMFQVYADSEIPDQTVHAHSLICAFAVRL